jgi:hypothetical protein
MVKSLLKKMENLDGGNNHLKPIRNKKNRERANLFSAGNPNYMGNGMFSNELILRNIKTSSEMQKLINYNKS